MIKFNPEYFPESEQSDKERLQIRYRELEVMKRDTEEEIERLKLQSAKVSDINKFTETLKAIEAEMLDVKEQLEQLDELGL